MKTLNEAIKHCRQVASKCDVSVECRAEHSQLAKWLTELKRFRKITTDKFKIYDTLRSDAIDFAKRNMQREDEPADNDYKISILRLAKDTAEDADIKVRMLDEILEYANENYEASHKVSSVFNP